MKARSDEFFPDTEDEEVESRERKDVVVRENSSNFTCTTTWTCDELFCWY